MDSEDVKREARKALEERPSFQRRKVGTKKQISTPRIAPVKFPSAEETGFPINGSLAEKDAHHRKYGRTPLHAKEVKDMMNNEAMVNGYVAAILSVTNTSHPDAPTFFAAIDAMLSWVPQPEKGSDWGINFARKAKKQLELLQERLPLLLERATSLSSSLAQRTGPLMSPNPVVQ